MIKSKAQNKFKVLNPKIKIFNLVFCAYFSRQAPLVSRRDPALILGSLAGIICALTFGFQSQALALNLDKIKANFLNGDYKSAIIEGEKMLAAENDETGLDELYYILGLSYLKDGNYLRASDIFEIILGEFKDSEFKEEAKLGLGDTYFVRGDFELAESYYRELINNDSGGKLKPQVYYRFSQTGFKKGDMQQGKEYLEKLKTEFPQSPEARINDETCALDSGGYYTVQVGSFFKKGNAESLTKKLTEAGHPAYMEEVSLQDKLSYRVKVGKLNTRQEALDLEGKLTRQGYPTKVCPYWINVL